MGGVREGGRERACMSTIALKPSEQGRPGVPTNFRFMYFKPEKSLNLRKVQLSRQSETTLMRLKESVPHSSSSRIFSRVKPHFLQLPRELLETADHVITSFQIGKNDSMRTVFTLC